ncbi:heme ABC transporter permease [Cupriavidus necator]|uniref:heme exporter protein CcmB n=1 Tax=Cupriavidus necator TaxID=106590 RepID=UPI000735492A|nr:heme exporter protein CcmB [Cupriavidus necator]KUE85283.1 heme ABC transporter permease [Cupriavidus necator]
MLDPVLKLIARELLLAWRRPSAVLTPLAFFVAVVSLFPLAVGPERMFLARLAPGVIWVAALLATLLGMERLFESDFRDGSLEVIALAPQSLTLMVLGKVTGFWLGAGLPLVLLTPLLGVQLGVPDGELAQLALSLLLGTPTLCLIAAIAAALTLSLQRGGPLLALLVLPLAAPVLVFGCGVAAASTAAELQANLSLLEACLLIAVASAPWATAAALRIGLESV